MLINNIPILSIVIPSRNREVYCIQAIDHILSYENINFELVIQDNSDSKKVKNHVSLINDSRLVYNYVAEPLNSLINMDFAISLAKGKYVIMIGDDDTVLPTIFDVVEYANKFNYDAISQNYTVNYNWPNAIKQGSSGTLSFKPFSFEKRIPDLQRNLQNLLKNGIVDYLNFDLPKVYHGIVKRDLLEKIKLKTNHYFGGLSPDIYSSISLSFFAEKFIIIDYPFTIGGACPKSSTAQNIAGGHRGELQSAPHLHLRGEYLWDKRIPRFYSVESIWAESAIKSLVELDKKHFLNLFNFQYFILFSLWRGKTIRMLIIKNILNDSSQRYHKLIQTIKILLSIFPFFLTKVKREFLNKKNLKVTTIAEVNDIRIATEILMRFVPDKFPFHQ